MLASEIHETVDAETNRKRNRFSKGITRETHRYNAGYFEVESEFTFTGLIMLKLYEVLWKDFVDLESTTILASIA